MKEIDMRTKVLSKALAYVTQDRNLDYDTPEKNFQMIADFWNIYLGSEPVAIKPHDVAVLNILTKIARLTTSPSKEDHWIDIAGYAACGAECIVDKEES